MGGLVIMSAGEPGPMNRPGSPARRARPRRHLRRRQHADAHELRRHRRRSWPRAGAPRAPERACEDAELRARVRLDAHLRPARLHRERGHARALPPLPARGPRRSPTRRRSRRSRVAPRLQPAGRPVDRRRSRGRWPRSRRVRAPGCVAGVISNSNGSVRSILEATGLGRASRLRHRLLRGGRREARSAHLRARAARAGVAAGRGGLRGRPLLGGRARRARGRARRASCSTRAASGAPRDCRARRRGARRRRCARCCRSRRAATSGSVT